MNHLHMEKLNKSHGKLCNQGEKMKTILIATTMAFGLAFFTPQTSEARPRNQATMSVEKKLNLYAKRCSLSKKSKKYKRYSRYCSRYEALKKKSARSTPVQQSAPDYQRVAEMFGHSEDDSSAAAFFMRDRARTIQINSNQTRSVAVKPSQKKVPSRNNSWFKQNPVAIARNFEGMNARRHRKELKTVMKIDPARIPWCAAFANAMLARAGYEGTGSLMARSFLNYGSVTYRPSEGDIAVFKRGRSRTAGHVGFYVGEQVINGKKYILTLGGNQSRSVNVAYIPASRLLGFRKVG